MHTDRETLISFIHTDETIVTDCDNDCRTLATYELLLHIPDDSTDESNTTVEYTCDAHLPLYFTQLTPNTALTELRNAHRKGHTMNANDLLALFARHTDEDLTDVLHLLVTTNRDDEVLLAKIASALHTSNILRADGTESPTI